MKREDVDHAPFAPDGERNLRRDNPFGHFAEQLGHLFMHRRVAGIQQPIELLAAPPEPNVKLSIERSGQLLDRFEVQTREVSTFCPRYCAARHTSSSCEVALRPAAA